MVSGGETRAYTVAITPLAPALAPFCLLGPGGGTGRYAILRGWCRKASRFESGPGHSKSDLPYCKPQTSDHPLSSPEVKSQRFGSLASEPRRLRSSRGTRSQRSASGDKRERVPTLLPSL